MNDDSPTAAPKALAFDVFGTVVDWHGSIVRDVGGFAREHGVEADWPAFANAWRSGYQPAMQRVRSGARAWTTIDVLHREILDDIAPGFGLADWTDADLAHVNRVWHRLDPWPDTLEGLALLKRRFTITTLSNGNFSLLVDMAKRAGLPWDCVVSAELFRHYKPEPEAYRGCAALLGIEPGELMLVAAHPDDLRAAARAGLRTAYVKRPREHGDGTRMPDYEDGEFEAVAEDFVDLARRFDERWFA